MQWVQNFMLGTKGSKDVWISNLKVHKHMNIYVNAFFRVLLKITLNDYDKFLDQTEEVIKFKKNLNLKFFQ